jgi:hypothetical protein
MMRIDELGERAKRLESKAIQILKTLGAKTQEHQALEALFSKYNASLKFL